MTVQLDEIIAGARAQNARDIGRLLSRVEDGDPQLPTILTALADAAGHAQVIGITGAPGVGKSTTTSALIKALRAQGKRVGVLAVDPSSPFSGGALLGDRVRMQEHATDPGVFIRSMASRGHLGGLARSTGQAIRVLDAAGFDVVLIETVGVGQSEVDIASSADTTLVLVAPGMGDGIQAAKAGILEIGDVIVVNKADRDGADQTARELRAMIQLDTDATWPVPVIPIVATTSQGLDELLTAIAEHATWLTETGEGHRRRLNRARNEIEAIAISRMRATIDDAKLTELAEASLAGTIDPYAAADQL